MADGKRSLGWREMAIAVERWPIEVITIIEKSQRGLSF
jgi:hypothetical protein